MFEKVKTILIKNATELTISIEKKEDSNSFLGTFWADKKQIKKIKTNKKKELLEIDFKDIHEPAILHLSYRELEELCFSESKVVIKQIDESISLKSIKCNTSKCEIESLFKESFKLTSLDSSNIILREYLINHARFEANYSSNFHFHKGAVHYASIYSYMLSDFSTYSDSNFIINVKDLYIEEVSCVKINVVNFLRHTLIRDSSRFLFVSGDACFESSPNYTDLNGNKIKCKKELFNAEHQDSKNASILNKSIKHNYNKTNDPFDEFSSAITESANTQKFVFPFFIDKSSEFDPCLLIETIKNEKENLSDIKRKISHLPNISQINSRLESLNSKNIHYQESLKNEYLKIIDFAENTSKKIVHHNFKLIKSYNRINQFLLKLDHETETITRKNFDVLLPKDDENAIWAFNQVELIKEKIKHLKDKVHKIEQNEDRKNEQYKNEDFLFNIVKHDFPTDYIVPENREKVIYLLSSEPAFFDYFKEKELEKINRLKITFNIKTKSICSFKNM